MQSDHYKDMAEWEAIRKALLTPRTTLSGAADSIEIVLDVTRRTSLAEPERYLLMLMAQHSVLMGRELTDLKERMNNDN